MTSFELVEVQGTFPDRTKECALSDVKVDDHYTDAF